ncbi:hypothetical protein G9A89_013861 [Geosiphon pyriformis]|nr:hypothetical protein G9A89_013861 [Geosiphon pyriformis]
MKDFVRAIFGLLLLSAQAFCTLRHRNSFFNEDFTRPDANTRTEGDTLLHYTKNDTIRVNSFWGIREWKLVAPARELLKTITNSEPLIELSPAWHKNWTARVQFATESLGHLPPFIIGPVPGLHVAISPGASDQTAADQRVISENEDFISICKYLDTFLGMFICDDKGKDRRSKYGVIDFEKSISIGDSIYLYTSQAYHHQYAILTSILGDYISRSETREPSIFDFSIKYDSKARQPIVDMRVVWRYKGNNAEISKDSRTDERLEIGMFETPLSDNTYFGLRTVIGHDENALKPTMITIPSKILEPTTYYFESLIEPAQGFHPIYYTNLTSSHTTHSSCQHHIVYILPDSFFIDPYQLQEMNSDDEIQLWGEIDLEKPIGGEILKWGSVVLVKAKKLNTENNVDKGNLLKTRLPLHMRYLQSAGPSIFESRSHVPAISPWPMVVQMCDDIDKQEGLRESPFAPTPLPISLLFRPPIAKINYFMPSDILEFTGTSRTYRWPIARVQMPVGQLQHQNIITWWSVLVSTLGFVCVAWVTLQKFVDWDSFFDKNKAD